MIVFYFGEKKQKRLLAKRLVCTYSSSIFLMYFALLLCQASNLTVFWERLCVPAVVHSYQCLLLFKFFEGRLFHIAVEIMGVKCSTRAHSLLSCLFFCCSINIHCL